MNHPIACLLAFGISCMAVLRLYRGWLSGKMVFFGSYRDWGPFDREAQPIRFWLCTAWLTLMALTLPIWIWVILDESMK